MKKNVLFVLFCIFAGSSAQALSEVELSGELDASFSVWNLPTGERGSSSFQIPSLFLNLNTPLKNDDLMVLQFEGSEEKTTSTERFDVKIREAYLDLVSVFPGMRALRVGLIPQVWQEAQYEEYSYRFLGRSAWGMTEKWNYMAPADLGLSYMTQMPWDLGEMAFTVANGEGAREKEDGPHKEASLFFRFNFSSPWMLNLNYIRGNYERYGDGGSLKERIQALLAYREENWSAGLELLATQDPAEAITNFKMAEGVDVTALSGNTIAGQGGSLYFTVKTGPLAEVLVRYDYLNAAVDESGKDLKTALAALSYSVSSDIRAALMADYTWYGENFAPGMRDESKIALATQVLF